MKLNSTTQMYNFPKDRKFFLLSNYDLIKNFTSTSMNDPNYIIVFYEDSNSKGRENIFNVIYFIRDFFFIQVISNNGNGPFLNFLIEKQNFNNGREFRLVTEIKKRKSIMNEILNIYKVNLIDSNISFSSKFDKSINSIFNLSFFLTQNNQTHIPQPINGNIINNNQISHTNLNNNKMHSQNYPPQGNNNINSNNNNNYNFIVNNGQQNYNSNFNNNNLITRNNIPNNSDSKKVLNNIDNNINIYEQNYHYNQNNYNSYTNSTQQNNIPNNNQGTYQNPYSINQNYNNFNNNQFNTQNNNNPNNNQFNNFSMPNNNPRNIYNNILSNNNNPYGNNNISGQPNNNEYWKNNKNGGNAMNQQEFNKNQTNSIINPPGSTNNQHYTKENLQGINNNNMIQQGTNMNQQGANRNIQESNNTNLQGFNMNQQIMYQNLQGNAKTNQQKSNEIGNNSNNQQGINIYQKENNSIKQNETNINQPGNNNNNNQQVNKDNNQNNGSEIIPFVPQKVMFSLKGLRNIGSTCYMNATLQCLLHVHELVTYFLEEFPRDQNFLNQVNKKVPSDGDISRAFFNLVDGVYNNTNSETLGSKKDINAKTGGINYKKVSKKKNSTGFSWGGFLFGNDDDSGDSYSYNYGNAFSPNDFKRALGLHNSQFRTFDANDSKDLILYLLQTLHEEMNYFGNKNVRLNYYPNQYDMAQTYNHFITIYNSNNFSKISQLFYGTYINTTICCKCNNKIYNFQKFEFISFGMYYYHKKNFNIIQGFADNSKPSKLTKDNQFLCNYCRKLQDALTICQIMEPPNKLLINIDYGKNKKYQPSYIQIDDIINITDIVPYDYKQQIKYQILGICTHYGSSGRYGHYVAFCRNKENDKWYEFNDSSCSEVKNKNTIYGGSPYLLLYERIFQ